MKFYYRSSINKEEMFTISQNRLKRTVKFNRKFLTNGEFNAGTVYKLFCYVSLFRFLIIRFCQITLASFPVNLSVPCCC